jgi:hypothetical protein
MSIRSNRPLTVSATTLTLNRNIHDNKVIRLTSTTGCAVTLPLATGTGAKFTVVLGAQLASGSVAVAASSTDTFTGYAIVEDAGDTTAADATIFATVNGTTDTWTSAATGGGGEIGDHIECVDIATGLWLVRAWGQAVLDSTATPFSGS